MLFDFNWSINERSRDIFNTETSILPQLNRSRVFVFFFFLSNRYRILKIFVFQLASKCVHVCMYDAQVKYADNYAKEASYG